MGERPDVKRPASGEPSARSGAPIAAAAVLAGSTGVSRPGRPSIGGVPAWGCASGLSVQIAAEPAVVCELALRFGPASLPGGLDTADPARTAAL
jgi:hypothetical protein